MTKEASMAMHWWSEILARMKYNIIKSQQSIGNDGDATGSNSGCNVGSGFSKPAKTLKQTIDWQCWKSWKNYK